MTSPGPSGHRSAAEAAFASLGIAVLTVSDTRNLATDTAGALLAERLGADGHRILDRRIVRDEVAAIRATVGEWLARDEVDVVVTTGGTGIARRDVTVQALEPFVGREVPGFGEVFRWLSYGEVGGAAVLSGAFAAIAYGPKPKVLIALPGSQGAVRLALERLLLPELRHLVWEARR
ncbi:MAG: molybdenum cofactor biosynthesis protein [Clostridia bacterium]|nr:molybdenum cofactor biosynthesis protein [Clostridia bacterium]